MSAGRTVAVATGGALVLAAAAPQVVDLYAVAVCGCAVVAVMAGPRRAAGRQRRRGAFTARSVLAAVWAVARVVAEAAEELVTAAVGVAPVTPRVRRRVAEVRADWRAARAGVIDAQVIEDEPGVWR